MAEYYCDISAVGQEYQAYAAAPTWGAGAADKPLPMDGSGKAGPGHSAAVAIAEIQITVLPADGNALAIAGATLTAKTTAAAKNQWTIGASIAACITNLRDLINTAGTGTAQCDAAVSASVCALALALPYWQFARVKPGTTDTLQIATRIAGADLNHASNSAVAITSSGWATPPTITQFAGGADGPFAYLYNTATIFGKSAGMTGTSYPQYGLFFAIAPGPSNPVLSDVIHCRTKRSGSNLAQGTWLTTGTINAWWQARSYLMDNGTVWSGDNGALTATFKTNSTTGNENYLGMASSVSFVSRGTNNFVLEVGSTAWAATQFGAFKAGGTNVLQFVRCKFAETSDNIGNGYVCRSGSAVNNVKADLSMSTSEFRGNSKPIFGPGANGCLNYSCVMNGHTVIVVAATTTLAAVIVFSTNTTGNVEWIGGEIRDTNGVYRCANPVSFASGVQAEAVIDGVVGVTDASASFTASATNIGKLVWNSPEGPNKGYRLETPRFAVDWKGDGTFPYAGAAADMRGVNWSHRVTWTSVPSPTFSVTPLRLSRFFRSASAIKTITLEIYVPDATTIYLDELALAVSYIDDTDVWRTEFLGGVSMQAATASRAAALSSSATSWTANGVASYSAKKLSITTAYPIKSGSEIIARLSLCASRSPSIVIYVSPELGVA